MDLGRSAADSIIEAVATPVVILNRDGEIVCFNRACEIMTGYSREEAIGRSVWEFLIPEGEIPAVREVFDRTRDAGGSTQFTNSWKSKSGELRVIEWSNRALEDSAGRAAYILAAGVDVTAVRSNERALSESRALLSSIINASPTAIVTIDVAGSILGFSRQAEETFGYSQAEVIGKPVKILMPPAEQLRHEGNMRRYIESNEAREFRITRPVTGLRANGQEFPAILHVTEFRDDQRVFVGFVEDITEQRATERRLADTQFELRHASRVGAMGEMATSIAHELNQPLTAAASFIEAVSLSLRKKDNPPRLEDAVVLLDEAVGEIRRASKIIRQMREFVRKRRSAKAVHKVNKVVEEACAIAVIGADEYGVDVETRFGADVGTASIDRIQIQQVVINLIRNAIDAMQESEEKHLTISTAMKDGMIEIRVADTGVGIPTAIKSRLFEPFATSKSDGMGVGLSISKSIVDAHQGEIFATENNENGSIFVVRLPTGGEGEGGASQ